MCLNPPADLVTFTKEIRNRKLHFLCSVLLSIWCRLLESTQMKGKRGKNMS